MNGVVRGALQGPQRALAGGSAGSAFGGGGGMRSGGMSVAVAGRPGRILQTTRTPTQLSLLPRPGLTR